MTTHIPTPLPPTTILSSKPISQSTAHGFLSAYLDRAATDPSLQPNAAISEHGPVSRTTAAAPNLILHNLKRVQAGLAGEVLGRDPVLQAFSHHHQGADVVKEEAEAAEESGEEGGWKDRRKWDQQQEVEEGDQDGVFGQLRNRGNYDNNDEGEDDEEEEGGLRAYRGDAIRVDETGMPLSGSSKLDKEERKRKKKERRHAEKRARAKETRTETQAVEMRE